MKLILKPVPMDNTAILARFNPGLVATSREIQMVNRICTTTIAVAALFMASSTAAPAQTVDSPQYLSWAKAGKGAMITMRSTTLMGDDPEPVISTMVYTLIDLKPDKAIIEMVTETNQAGKTVTNPPQEYTIRRAFPLLPGITKEDIGRPMNALEKGTETLKLAGTEFQAEWYATKGKTDAGPSTTKTWQSTEVPGMLLRSVTLVPRVKAIITLELIAFKKP